jgi:two-component system LytT family response regulator
MYTSLIIDDEINGAEALQVLVQEYCKEVSVTAIETHPQRAIELIETTQPDFIFLDIEMPEMNGFELLSDISTPLPKVIFTTAYSEYAVKAFRYNAIDYLLKPVIAEELISAVNKCKEKIQHKHRPVAAHAVDSIFIQENNSVLPISIHQIITLQADSNYTRLCLMGGQKILSAKTLKEYEELLPKEYFYRVHKTHIVNMLYIEKYMRGENAYLIMKDQSTIEVSRRKKSDFLLNFCKGKGV